MNRLPRSPILLACVLLASRESDAAYDEGNVKEGKRLKRLADKMYRDAHGDDEGWQAMWRWIDE